MDPYPNVKDVNAVKIISYNGIYYVFGGKVNNEVTKDILSFEKETWSRVGSLSSERINFSVILNVEKVYVIGGQKNQKHDLCTLSNIVNCEQNVDGFSNFEFQASENPVMIGVRSDVSCNLTVSTSESKETKELMILSNATFKEVDHFVPVKTNYRSDKQTFNMLLSNHSFWFKIIRYFN